jgi:MYXO-CTERM domain-containing protein
MTARALLTTSVALAVVGALPASAAADGLPAVGIDARPLSAPRGDVEYLTKTGKRSTRLIERGRVAGPQRERRIRGVFSIPAVAYDSSPSGIAANGRTLILISPRTRYPRKRTTFAVVDPRRLSIRRLIHLKGDFSFDAISPDGLLMYLIEYDPQNLTQYAVRAYNMRARNLVPDPVVDPNEPEPMTGVPVTRTSSMDGRWAYTLYDSQEHPFVHALDTARRTAVCIDLDDLPRAWGSSLELHGPRLDVVGPAGRIRATINTRTHKLVKSRAEHTEDAEDAGTSWLPIAAPTAALLLLAAFGRRRRGNHAPTAPGTIDG